MKLLRKYILAFVSFAMLISAIHVHPMHVHAQETKSKTDAEMIIDNYSLTSKEQSILLHETINTKRYEYVQPLDQDANNLISVDADNFIVEAKTYTDAFGNIWTPVKVIVSENESSKEYKIDDGKAKFKADGDNYSVEVKYDLYVSVSKDTQLRLLNTPYWLCNAIDALDVLYSVSNDLKSVADYYMPELINLRDGKDTPLGVSISDPGYVNAVTDLEKQLKNNRYSTKYFDINEEIKIYEPYSGISDQEYYFSSHALDLKEDAKKMKKNLEDIVNSQGFETIIKFASMMDEFKDKIVLIETMLNYMATIVDDLDYALAEDNWKGTKYKLLSVIEGDTGLVNLLTKRGSVDKHTMDEVNDKLFVDSKTLKCTINRNRVNVIVQAYVINEKDSDELTLIEALPVEIALKHEMSAQDVANAIINKGIEDNILKQWADKYQVCEDYYVRTTNDFGDKLVEDITYTITYTPKKYNVIYSDNGDAPLNVYYGYQLTLPKASSGFSYEYTIGNEKYRENDVLRIVGDTTIDRIIGKQKVVNRLLNVLANDSTYGFNDLAKAILTNEAVKSEMVEYRIVEEMDVNTVIDYDNESKTYSLTVNSYPSGIDGMMWEPVAFAVVKGNKESGGKQSLSNGQATFKTDYLDGVNVYYELDVIKTENIRPVHITNKYLLTLVNLPSTLLAESKEQIESLDYLASLAKPGGYLTMGSTIYSALGMIKSNYESNYGKDTSQYPEHILKEYNALIELRNECFNHSNGSQLYVYEYIMKYNELGLIAYYSDEYGYDQYQYQLNLLVKNLTIVKNSEEFNSLLTGQLAPYKEKVEKLIDVLDDLVLVKPNPYIDASHASAGKLFDLLDDKKSYKSYESVSSLTDRTSVHKPLEGKVSIIMSAHVDGVKYNTTAVVYDLNKKLTQEDIDFIKKTFNELYSGFNSKYYTKSEAVQFPKVGQELTENLYLNESWKSKLFNVYVLDTSTNKKEFLQSVTYKDTVITLGKPGIGYRYDYQILDEVRSAETAPITYTITTENFDKLFESGELVIKRTTVDLTREKLVNMINTLNEPFKDYNSGFVLTKDSKGYHAIFRVDPSERDDVQKLILSVVVKMKDSNYGYVALNNKDNALWNAATAELSVQAYLNAMLQGGLNTNQFINLINEDGNIKENVIDTIGKKQSVIVGKESDLDMLGGFLYNSVLYLGTTDHDEAYIEVNFVVSIEDFDKQSDLLKQTRMNLINAKKYHSFDVSQGQLNLTHTLSDKSYSLILSAMVLTGVADLDKVNDLTFEDVMKYFKENEHLFKNGKLSSSTIQNTYNQLGIDIDLSDRSELLNSLLELNNTHSFKKNKESIENGASGQFQYDLEKTLNELNIPKETQVLLKETELSVPTIVTCTNIDEDYEAVIFNPYQSHPIEFIKVLDEDVKLSHEDNSIILLKDIDHNLKLDKVSSLDLNGYEVKGSIQSNSDCVISDSKNSGSVSGSLSKNIKVTGGSYSVFNLDSYVKEGYKVVGSRVTHKYYTITQKDGNEVVEIDPQLFYESKDYFNVLMNIIVSLNDYSKAKVKIGEHEVYLSSYQTILDFTKEKSSDDLINDILDELNVEGLFNELLQSFNNYEVIADTQQIAKYQMDTHSYVFELDVNTNKDVIEGNIKISEEPLSKEVVIQVKEDKAYKNAVTVLKDIVDVEYEDIKVNDIHYNDTLTSDLDNVKVNINVNNDVKYTIMLGVILAYGTNDAQLIDAMKNYMANDSKRENLKLNLLNAIHDLSTKEIVDAIKLVSESNMTFTQLAQKLELGHFNQATNENNLDAHLDSVLQDYVDFIVSKFNLYGITGDSSLLKTSIKKKNFESFDEVQVSLSLIAELPCRHRSTYEIMTIEPTCTKEGIIEVRCEECNEVLSKKSIEPKGHGDSQLVGVKEATCEENGYTGDVVCVVCGDVLVKGEVIQAKGHSTSIHNAVEPTCKNVGYTGDTICDICGKMVSKGTIIKKIPHHYINGICEMCNEKDPHYSPYLTGDVSGDGKVNALDYIKIKNHIMGTKYLSEDELRRADVSGDNKISALDYIKIKNHIMGIKRLF